MTEREQLIEQHLCVIRSFALILTKDNWRDVEPHIRIQFDALKEFADGELSDGRAGRPPASALDAPGNKES